jgi:UDP-N-acetylmuramate--alanine ligase
LVKFSPEFAAAVNAVVAEAREGDLILTLGAGSVSQLAPQILAALETDEAPGTKMGKL